MQEGLGGAGEGGGWPAGGSAPALEVSHLFYSPPGLRRGPQFQPFKVEELQRIILITFLQIKSKRI